MTQEKEKIMTEASGGDGSLVTQQGATTTIDTGSLPTGGASTPALNEAQQLFAERFANNETFKPFLSHEDPFQAVAERLSTPVEGLKVPGENATAEELSAWRKAIGAFDTAEGYKYEPPTTDDEALKALLPSADTPMPFAEAFAEIAAKTNMPESTWKEITAGYNQMLIESAKIEQEMMAKASQTIAENWKKAHGENAPQVGQVFQKYFATASPEESQILSTLSAEQVAALGSAIYKHDRMVMSEDGIDTKNIGSSTLSETDYVLKRSELLAQKAKLDREGKAWSVEARKIQAELKQLSDRQFNR